MEAAINFLKQNIFFVEIGLKSVAEILILTVILYYVINWMKDSRAMGLLRGLLVLAVLVAAANVLQLNVIIFIAEKTVNVLVIALLVIFQPELRDALMQLGTRSGVSRLLKTDKNRESGARYTHRTTEELVRGCRELARNKTGALIVIEREIPLKEYAKTGISLDAQTTGALLINIFEKNTPLHDGAVIMKQGRIQAATCYLPLSSNGEINKNLGTRHRAAIGISEVTDSVTIVVSEETGSISLAQGGQLQHDLTLEQLGDALKVLEGEGGRAKGRHSRKNGTAAQPQAPAEKEETHA